MITKFISSAMVIITLNVYLQSQVHSSDLLFLFTSSNLLMNSIMLALASLSLYVSFKKNFKSWYGFAVCAAAAIALGLIGTIGSFFSDVDYVFSNILLPLNYLFILQTAVILGICSLSYEHAPMPQSVKQLPTSLVNKLQVLIPKLPRTSAPNTGNRVRHA